MRQCNKCLRILSLDKFYKSRPIRCKDCIKARVGIYRIANHAKVCEYDRARAKEPDRKRKVVGYFLKMNRKSPEKRAARVAVGNAVRDGRLIKAPCVYCGEPKVQAHHADYSKPLDVTWECFKCHREREHGHWVEIEHKEKIQ